MAGAIFISQLKADNAGQLVENPTTNELVVQDDHDYCQERARLDTAKETTVTVLTTTTFAKCEMCRKTRTKVMIPPALVNLLDVPDSKNDGKTCDFCGAVMTSAENPSTIKTARENTRIRERISCDICGKEVLKESLNKHIQQIHDKSNKMACQFCKKVLTGAASLKAHVETVHEGVLNHVCPHCQKGFANISNMNRHVQRIHEKIVVTSKYVSCNLCQKLVQVPSLKKHLKNVHEQARDHICNICHKGFSESYSLKEHIAAKHAKVNQYQCDQCHRRFAHRTNYTRHMKKVHEINILDLKNCNKITDS